VACRGCLVGLVKNPGANTNGDNYDVVAEAEGILADASLPALV